MRGIRFCQASSAASLSIASFEKREYLGQAKLVTVKYRSTSSPRSIDDVDFGQDLLAWLKR